MHSNPNKGTPKSSEAKFPAGKTDLKEQIGGMQNLLDSYPGSMFSIDQNYLYTAYNSTHFKMVQEIYGKEIQLGHSPLEYIANRDYPTIAKQKLDQVLSSGEAFIDRDFPIKIAGSDVFFDINYIPIKDEKGTVIGVSVFAEDVTLYKKSKDARKETEELYSNLFMEISSIILIIDVETKSIVEANQAACAFYGYSHSELTALKISDLAVLSAEELHSRIQKVANGEANHFQLPHRLANGEIREVESYVGGTVFNGRRVFVAIIHDISASKAAEGALKLSEERYKTQFKNLPVPTYTWQHKGDDFILIDYNDSASIITEGGVNKLLGKAVSELYKDNPQILSDISTCFNEQRTIRRETKTPLRSTGVMRDLIVTYVYIPSDLVQVHTEDITQRKMDEEKLRANEERLREILENLQDAPYRRNLKTDKYDYLSPSIEQISGFTAEETIAMTTGTVLAYMHPDDLANIEQTIAESITYPDRSYQVEYRFKHRHTNQYYWFQDRFKTALDAQGQPMFRYGTVRNITEHKLAEDKLRDSEERYRLVVENSYDAILLTNSDGSVLNANSAAARMFGMTEEEIIQADRSKLIDINDPSFAPAINERERNRKYTGVLTFIRKDGSTFPAEITSTLFQDKDENPRASVIIHDITERRRAEEAKQEAEARYRGLFEQSHDAIFILDFQGRHLTANQHAADMMGYTIEEMHGLSVRETSAELQKSTHVIQRLLNGEHVPLYERLFQKKDGTIFPVEINVELVCDSHGNPLHIQSVVRDISERKLAEEKLRESEERWQFALEGAGDGVWDWNARTNKVFFSSRWKSMLGYADDEIGDSLDEWQNRVHPDDLSGALDKVNQHLEGRSPYYTSEHRLLCKDGSYKWILDRGKVVEWTADKKPLRVIGTHRDITELKIAEEKLRENEEQYRTFVEQSFDGIAFVDELGNIVEWNRTNENLSGLKKEDVFGKPYWEIQQQLTPPEFRTPEVLERFKTTMLEMIRTGQSPFFNRINHGELIGMDGTKKIIEQIAFPITTKNGFGIRSLTRDVTARKQAEEKLSDSEERFRLLFERSQAVMIIVEPATGKILDANPAAENFYGYSVEELRNMSIEKINILPPETVAAERQLALAEKRNLFVFPHRLANGETRTVEVHSSPILMKGRQVLFSIIHDVTKRKLAEEKLIESEERFSTAFHSSQEAISITRISDDVYIDVNDAFCSVFELSRGQVIGRKSKELNLWVNPDERDELFKAIHEKGQVPNFESQFRTKTGRIGFMQASMGHTTIAGEECVLIFGRDITARKLAEEKLRESEENYRTFVEQGFDGIMFVDNHGVIVEWNRAREVLTGLKKENVLGKTYWDVRFQLTPAELRTPERLQRFKESTFEMLQPGQSKFLNHVTEGEMVSASGERRFIEQIAFRVITKNGYGIRSVTRDITARKKAEAELRAAHEELEQRVRERTLELQTALSSLQRVARVKDEFLASMGHELRTPLNIILGSAQLLQESVYGALNEKQTRAITSIENGGEKLLNLINNILDLSKLQSGELSPIMAPSSLGDICRSVLNLTASSSKKKQLQVDFSIAPNEIMLHTDELRVQQILLILFDNAIKFTPSGGKIGIDVAGDQKNKHIKITVWDTGIGISPDNLPRLFQSFVQLDARLSREYEGSGLGLALAQQLAEIFGGSISVESIVGKGSRFTFTLPWTEQD